MQIPKVPPRAALNSESTLESILLEVVVYLWGML